MQGLRAYLLGGFRLEQSEQAIRNIASTDARLLFSFLLLNREQVHRRDLVVGVIWPDEEESAARKKLSQTLWRIRDAFEEDSERAPLTTHGDTLGIAPDVEVWVDANEFERLARSQVDDLEQLRAAHDLYAGDLLAGFYADWVVAEQERLRLLFSDVLRRLVRAEKAAGDYESAHSAARRLILSDPLDEEAYRECMRLLTLLGRPNEALATYESCVAILEQELGIAPSAETVALAGEVATEEASAPLAKHPSDGDGSLPLIGRQHERSQLVGLIDDTLKGTGAIALVEGTPGIGKTRLIEEAAADARWRGFDVAWISCSPASEGRPFGVIAEMLTAGLSSLRSEQLRESLEPATLADVSRLAPNIGPRSSLPSLRAGEDQDRLNHAVIETICRRATLRPLLVVVDDVHHADDASLEALTRLAPCSDDYPLLFFISYERAEAELRDSVWSTIRGLDRAGKRLRVDLRPLEAGHSRQLAEAASDGQPDGTQEAITRAAGNPLFLLESLRAMRDGTQAVGGRVADVIERRLRSLDQPTRTVVNAMAVLDGAAPLSAIRAIAEVDRSDVAAGLDLLLGRRIATQVSEGFVLTHRQVGLTAFAGIEPDERAQLHRRAAEHLQALNSPDTAAVARHYALAGMEEEAAQMYVTAAEIALELSAYEVAANHFGSASSLVEPDHKFRVLERRERTLDILGKRNEQAEILMELETLARDDQERILVGIRAVNHAVQTSRSAQAEETAAVLLRDGLPPDHEVELLTVLGRGLRWAGRASDSIEVLNRAIGLAGPRSEPDVRTELGASLAELHHFDEAERQLASAQRMFAEDGNRRGVAEAQGKLGIVHFERGAHAESETALGAAIASCSALGYRYGLAVNTANLGTIHHMGGRPALAMDLMNQALQIWQELGDLRNQTLVATNLASLKLSYLGPSDQIQAEAQWALERARELGNPTLAGQNLETLAWVSYGSGGKRRARRLMEDARAEAQRGEERYIETQIAWSQALLEWQTGSRRKAKGLADELVQHTRELGFSKLATMANGLGAYLAFESGDLDAARSLSEEIEGQLEGVEHAAQLGLWRFLILDASGERPAADSVLDRAYRRMMESLLGFDAETRAVSLDRVAAHRDVRDAWLHRFPLVVERPLTRAGVPTGRPVRDDEFVTVALTVSDPSDLGEVKPAARRARALQRIAAQAEAAGATPTIEDLADLLSVSPTTIKRDLASLRRMGITLRTRGNA